VNFARQQVPPRRPEDRALLVFYTIAALNYLSLPDLKSSAVFEEFHEFRYVIYS
jgi:hypothetical protein